MQLHLRSIVELQPDPALYDNVIVNGLRSMHAGTVGFEQHCQPRKMLKLLAVRLDRVEAVPEHHRRGRDLDHQKARLARPRDRLYADRRCYSHLTGRSIRSEERRVGEGGVSTCRLQWSTNQKK